MKLNTWIPFAAGFLIPLAMQTNWDSTTRVLKQLGFALLGLFIVYPIPMFTIMFGTWGVVRFLSILAEIGKKK